MATNVTRQQVFLLVQIVRHAVQQNVGLSCSLEWCFIRLVGAKTLLGARSLTTRSKDAIRLEAISMRLDSLACSVSCSKDIPLV